MPALDVDDYRSFYSYKQYSKLNENLSYWKKENYLLMLQNVMWNSYREEYMNVCIYRKKKL